jgi:hypothetical protein
MKVINSSVRTSIVDRLGASVKPKQLAAFKRIERRQLRARERQFMITEELPMALDMLSDEIQIQSNLHARFARKMNRKVKRMVDQVVSKDVAWLTKRLVMQEVHITYNERGRPVCERHILSRAYCG